MLIVEPPASRFSDNEAVGASEEHLLERVSSLESKVGRLTEKLELALQLLVQQASCSDSDRSPIDSLIANPADDGITRRMRRENQRRARRASDTDAQVDQEALGKLRRSILSECSGIDGSGFERELDAGLEKVGRGRIEEGAEVLCRACAKLKVLAPMLVFWGEYFFENENTKVAIRFLEQAQAALEPHAALNLLLGLLYGEDGQPLAAERVLRNAIRLGCSSWSVYFALARVLVALEQFNESLTFFRKAAKTGPPAECDLAIAEIYYRQERFGMCERYLDKAIRFDRDCPGIDNLVRLLLLRRNETTSKRGLSQAGAQQKLAKRPEEPREYSRAEKLSGNSRSTRKVLSGDQARLLTRGDGALVRKLLEDAGSVAVRYESRER